MNEMDSNPCTAHWPVHCRLFVQITVAYVNVDRIRICLNEF
jgi:hypothetical protein